MQTPQSNRLVKRSVATPPEAMPTTAELRHLLSLTESVLTVDEDREWLADRHRSLATSASSWTSSEPARRQRVRRQTSPSSSPMKPTHEVRRRPTLSGSAASPSDRIVDGVERAVGELLSDGRHGNEATPSDALVRTTSARFGFYGPRAAAVIEKTKSFPALVFHGAEPT